LRLPSPSPRVCRDGTGKGETGPSLQEKLNKALHQIGRAQRLGEDLIREDLCDEDHISASQDQDAPRSTNPCDHHNASVRQTTRSAGTREGRYRPTRCKTFIDRLQTAKREKEELKIKSMDSSTAHQRAYIVENLRKNSNHKVEIGKSPSCGCADFVKNSGKELCKHMAQTLLNITYFFPETTGAFHSTKNSGVNFRKFPWANGTDFFRVQNDKPRSFVRLEFFSDFEV